VPRTDAASTRVAGQQEPDLDLELLDAYWRAANYLPVVQIYLLDNPLLRVAVPDISADAAVPDPAQQAVL
jgi:phosphoketolase